jgi:hypothetical protein
MRNEKHFRDLMQRYNTLMNSSHALDTLIDDLSSTGDATRPALKLLRLARCKLDDVVSTVEDEVNTIGEEEGERQPL